MIVRFEPGKFLKGGLRIPSSKSYLHRTLICACLSDKSTQIAFCGKLCDDIKATISALKALGAEIIINNNNIIVFPIVKETCYAEIDCSGSASTLRFMMSLAPVLCNKTLLKGNRQLSERPIDEMISVLKSKGLHIKGNKLPLTVEGRLKSGVYHVSQAVTTQIVSSFLMSLAALNGESAIMTSTANAESPSYISLTLNVMRLFGVNAISSKNGFILRQTEKYISPEKISAQADWSSACFWLAANFMGSNIDLLNLEHNSFQPDERIKNMLHLINTEKSVRLDCGECPDSVPALCAAACSAKKTVIIENISKLKYKESNRINALKSAFSSIGADICAQSDALVVNGTGSLQGGKTSCFDDHRIAMSLAVSSAICKEAVEIEGFESVSKSYPDFLKDYQSLGGTADVV